MKVLTDTEKAHVFLQHVEYDIRKFLEDGEGVTPFEYFEDVHIALVEALNLLGVGMDVQYEDDDELDDALIAEGEEREHARDLENFDPITHIEAQERTGELK
jgi:hypothetical protein